MLKIGEKLLVKNQVWSIVSIENGIVKLEKNGQLLKVKQEKITLF